MYKGRSFQDFNDVQIDQALFDHLIEDKKNKDPVYLSADRWEKRVEENKSTESIQFQALQKNLLDWVGHNGVRTPEDEEISDYHSFMEKSLEINVDARFDVLKENAPILADYNTVLDVLTLKRFIFDSLDTKDTKNVRVLEVGGGYGRLAEGLLKEFDNIGQIIEVDSVVDSLCYCHAYLKKAFPNKKIALYGYDTKTVEGYDIVVCPSWRLRELNVNNVDLFINISSFQEMQDEQVEMYLSWWDQISSSQAFYYVANSRDFFYRREYVFPETWKLKFKDRTPRSNTPDFPTEIFQKTDENCRDYNQEFETSYYKTIIPIYREALGDAIEKKQFYMKNAQRRQERIHDSGLLPKIKKFSLMKSKHSK